MWHTCFSLYKKSVPVYGISLLSKWLLTRPWYFRKQIDLTATKRISFLFKIHFNNNSTGFVLWELKKCVDKRTNSTRPWWKKIKDRHVCSVQVISLEEWKHSSWSPLNNGRSFWLSRCRENPLSLSSRRRQHHKRRFIRWHEGFEFMKGSAELKVYRLVFQKKLKRNLLVSNVLMTFKDCLFSWRSVGSGDGCGFPGEKIVNSVLFVRLFLFLTLTLKMW